MGVGVTSAPLKHIKPADHCAPPLLVFLKTVKLVGIVVVVLVIGVVVELSKNAQIPPQICAALTTVTGTLETLNNLTLGAAVIVVLATVCEGKIL